MNVMLLLDNGDTFILTVQQIDKKGHVDSPIQIDENGSILPALFPSLFMEETCSTVKIKGLILFSRGVENIDLLCSRFQPGITLTIDGENTYLVSDIKAECSPYDKAKPLFVSVELTAKCYFPV